MNAHQLYIAATILEKCAAGLREQARRALNDGAPLPMPSIDAYTATIAHGSKLLREALTQTTP